VIASASSLSSPTTAPATTVGPPMAIAAIACGLAAVFVGAGG
jgi:hypothetical protein